MNDKVLDKLKKLLRLAESSNPHEAALALSRAQKLMQEHGIDSDAPELAGVCESTIDALTKAQTPTQYFHCLVDMVAKVFGCTYYFQRTFINMQVVFIGHDERPVIAGYVLTVLERQLSKARRDFINSLSNRMKKTTKTKRADNFCEGWCMGVYRKIEAFALTEKEQSELIEYKNKTELTCRESRSAKSAGRSTDESRYKGYVAAKDVTLNQGVSGQESKRLTA
ncbi:DUF2786 domain-containing protein [Shewanella xiamenensis]|uniref:DUF2786 domain-containing protein n=1 Tax=Shewanella xiamenensis TaxID=332186 RepID=UPI003F1E40F6